MLRNEPLIQFVDDINNAIMQYVIGYENLLITPKFTWARIENSTIPEHRKTNIGNIVILCQVALFENHSIISLSRDIKSELEKNWYTGSWFRATGYSTLRTKLNLLLDDYLNKLEAINHSLSNSVVHLNLTVSELKHVINENQTVIEELESHLKDAYQENSDLQNKIDSLEHNIQNQILNRNQNPVASYNNNNRLFKLDDRNSDEKKESAVNKQEGEKIVFR